MDDGESGCYGTPYLQMSEALTGADNSFQRCLLVLR